MTLFSRIIYFPVSSVSLFCVSAERVFFRLALFYMIFLQTTEADRWGDFIQSVLNGLACVAGAHRLCFLQAARRRHAKGRGFPPLTLFKGRGWLHTDHILENSHPFVSTPPPPSPVSQCYRGHQTLQSDLNLCWGKAKCMSASKSFGEDCGPWAFYLAPLYSKIYGNSSFCKATVVLRIFTALNRGYMVSRHSQLWCSVIRSGWSKCILFVAPCKGIQGTLGFWIPRRGFRIPFTGFQIFFSGTWIPDSNC